MRMGLGVGAEVERGVEMEMSMSWRLEWAGMQTGMRIRTGLKIQKGDGDRAGALVGPGGDRGLMGRAGCGELWPGRG